MPCLRHLAQCGVRVACAWRCANSSNAAPCNCRTRVGGSARGARLPVCSRNAIQRSMVGRLMRNNRCAVILLMPASSEPKTRSRKSMLYPLDIQISVIQTRLGNIAVKPRCHIRPLINGNRCVRRLIRVLPRIASGKSSGVGVAGCSDMRVFQLQNCLQLLAATFHNANRLKQKRETRILASPFSALSALIFQF